MKIVLTLTLLLTISPTICIGGERTIGGGPSPDANIIVRPGLMRAGGLTWPSEYSNPHLEVDGLLDDIRFARIKHIESLPEDLELNTYPTRRFGFRELSVSNMIAAEISGLYKTKLPKGWSKIKLKAGTLDKLNSAVYQGYLSYDEIYETSYPYGVNFEAKYFLD